MATNLLKQIVQHELEGVLGSDEDAVNAAFSYAIKIVLANRNRQASAAALTEDELASAITSTLQQVGAGTAALERFDILKEKIKLLVGVDSRLRTSALSLLHELQIQATVTRSPAPQQRLSKEIRSESPMDSSNLPLGAAEMEASMPSAASQDKKFVPSHTFDEHDLGSQPQSQLIAQRVWEQQAVDKASDPSEGGTALGVAFNHHDSIDHRDSSFSRGPHLSTEAFKIPEASVVRDLLIVCMATNGRYFKYSSEKDAYTLSDGYEIPDSISAHAAKVCECGWLYRKVTSIIQDDLSSNGSAGPTQKALSEAVAMELRGYLRVIRGLQQQFNSASADPQAEPPRQFPTLPFLLFSVSTWWETLMWLAVLLDKSRKLSGGKLIQVLHLLSSNGDPRVRKLYSGLLSVAITPIVEALKKWVVYGLLTDLSGELFITEDTAASSTQLWTSRYQINLDMLPSYCISMDFARKILRAGKTVNFLLKGCKDKGVIAAAEEGLQKAKEMHPKTVAKPLDQLRVLVDAVLPCVEKRAMRVVVKDHSLMHHCLLMKDFVLLFQGAFVRELVEKLGPELGRIASQVSVVTLSGNVHSALRASTASHEEMDMLERLTVRLLPMSERNTIGWDVFFLEYIINPPLDAVLSEDSLNKYREISRFLLEVSRAEYYLACVWKLLQPRCPLMQSFSFCKLSVGASRTTRGPPSTLQTQSIPWEDERVKLALMKCLELRALMFNVVSSLSQYFMLEAIGTSWQAFVRGMQGASGLDDVIAAHNLYISTVMQKTFLDSELEYLHENLLQIFLLARQFYSSATRLKLFVDAIFVSQQEDQMAKDSSNWMTKGARGLGLPSASSIDDIIEELHEMKLKFIELRSGLIRIMNTQEQLDLRSLCLRLDFSP